MDIVVIKSGPSGPGAELFEQMFRLRAKVFRDRLGWDVLVEGGSERDQFDALDPDYLVAVSGLGKVVGSVRLLPAIGPTMLQTVFPELLAGGKLNATEKTVESSRFCVDTERAKDSSSFFHDATLSLFAGIITWSMTNGYNEIVTATDLRFERLLRHAGWPLQRLGEPHLIGNVKSIAGRLPADRHYLDLLKPKEFQMRELRSSPARQVR